VSFPVGDFKRFRFRPSSSSEFLGSPTVDVVRRYRPRASRLHSCGFAARWCVSLPWFRGPIGLPVHTVGRGCDATSTPDASRCRFTTATAPASALVVNRRRRPVELPPRLTGSSRVDSHEVSRLSASLQHSPVAPCRRRGCRPRDYPAPAFSVRPAPTGWTCALAVFRRLAPALLFFRVAGAAARVIRRRFRFSATYRARAGWFSRPGRTRVVARPPTLVGFAVPFAALILSAGENRVSTPRAHVPFGSFLRRGCFSSRLSRQAVATVGETRRAASGLWPRGQAVPCGPPAPL
jgi:hypothetical protein